MRGSSKSMRQTGGGGVIANKSMAVSKVMGGNSFVDGIGGKSILQNKSIKKVEGHDFGKTSKSNFEQTVNNLKNKPNQKVVEDEYINVHMVEVRGYNSK